jgi:hypothetical protein
MAAVQWPEAVGGVSLAGSSATAPVSRPSGPIAGEVEKLAP